MFILRINCSFIQTEAPSITCIFWVVISSLRTGHCFELSVIVDLVNKEEIPHLPSVGPDLSEARKLIIFLLINFLHCFFTPLPAVKGLLWALVTRLVIISDYQVSFFIELYEHYYYYYYNLWLLWLQTEGQGGRLTTSNNNLYSLSISGLISINCGLQAGEEMLGLTGLFYHF